MKAIRYRLPNSMHADRVLYEKALKRFMESMARSLPSFINETAQRRGWSEDVWRVRPFITVMMLLN